jgi:hypothetical protein
LAIKTTQIVTILMVCLQMKLMKNVGGYDKKELNRVMGVIEDTLKPHWGDHDGFINLQERLLALKMILDEHGDGFVKGMNVEGYQSQTTV